MAEVNSIYLLKIFYFYVYMSVKVYVCSHKHTHASMEAAAVTGISETPDVGSGNGLRSFA